MKKVDTMEVAKQQKHLNEEQQLKLGNVLNKFTVIQWKTW
jgi:hypothetical protein